MLPVVIALLAPVETGVFGVTLGGPVEPAAQAFAPVGQTAAGAWSRTPDAATIIWKCEAQARCFGVPSRALFHLTDKKVGAVSLSVASRAAAPGQPADKVLLEVLGVAKLGAPIAASAAAGRQVRYYRKDGVTTAWAQDGADAEIKLALDALDPVPLAEAVAAGAKVDLKPYPGAADYAVAHAAIGKRDWAAAEAALEKVVAQKKAAAPLRDQARLVLAMALAARVKAAGPPATDKEAARATLDRAVKLAPELKPDIDALKQTLGLSTP